jgi:hypothetical protein
VLPINVESGIFVRLFGESGVYVLGLTEAGLARAVRRMNELRREIQAEVA